LGNSLKWTAITIAVIAGILLGFALTTFAYRHQILHVPVHRGFVERLNRELNLTPDQLHKVEDLVRDTHTKMEQLHEDFHTKHQALIMSTHDQIRALLTPEQQQKFDLEFTPPPEHDPEGHFEHGGD
jgi:Spy/CpxP family protein refolding chaperone